jgi:Cof subfamily protein (haloacid dehalogenase superfamily)
MIPFQRNRIRRCMQQQVDDRRLAALRLVLFDLDGTLLRDDGSVGPRTLQQLERLHAHGVRFSLASGRHYHAMRGIAGRLPVDLPLICLDGALVIDPSSGTPLFSKPLSSRKVRAILLYAGHNLLDVALSCVDAIYCLPHHRIMETFTGKIDACYKEIDDHRDVPEEVLEVYLAGEDYHVLKALEKRMKFPRSMGLATHLYPVPRQEGIYCLEIRRAGTDKADGLRRLLRCGDISLSATAVTGDWHNDRQLFETAALKVAVANAARSIRRRADLVLERTNDEEGLADFLEMVLRAKTENKKVGKQKN